MGQTGNLSVPADGAQIHSAMLSGEEGANLALAIHPHRPPVFRFPAGFLSVLLLAAPRQALAQASIYIPLDDPVYHDIRSATLRGLLPELDPTALPYTYGELQTALAENGDEHPILARIRLAVQPAAVREGTGWTGRGGARMTSHGRLDPVRRLGGGGEHLYPYLETGIHWNNGPVVARAGLRFDYYFDRDPDGLDSVLRAYMRNDQSYAGLMYDRGRVHIGRIATHWAVPGAQGTMLSGNPRSFDALHLGFGTNRLKVRSMIGELDSITGDGRFTGTAGDDSVSSGSERRWMAAHRLDWRPGARFQITVLEAALFSGPNTGMSLKYLNPVQFMTLSVDNRPKNDENNALIGLMVWAQTGDWTLDYQIMFDDFDLAFGTEPASFSTSLGIARPLSKRWDASARVTAVASRSYNTFQPEGRWLYLGRGLATQFSDFVEAEFRATLLAGGAAGLRIEPYAVMLAQGQRDIRQPFRFGDDFEAILVGTVQRTLRGAVRAVAVRGQGYASMDAGINAVRNEDHVEGRTGAYPVIVVSLGLRGNVGRSR